MKNEVAQFHADGLVSVTVVSKPGSLFHYTKNIDSLYGILDNGLRFSYCFEEHSESVAKCIQRSSGNNMELLGSPQIQYGIAMPMICFCDIPILKASNHRQKYGNYCIGFDKEKCRRALPALNPIWYVSSNWIDLVCDKLVRALPTKEEIDNYQSRIQQITLTAENEVQGAGMIKRAIEQGTLSDNVKYDANFISAILELISIVKPYDNKGNCYYDEHEWRIYFTPAGHAKYGITQDEYEKNRSIWNSSLWEMDYGFILLDNPHDIITHIIVQKDDEIHPLVLKIKDSECVFGKKITEEQKSLLVSKITSFERISCDF